MGDEAAMVEARGIGIWLRDLLLKDETGARVRKASKAKGKAKGRKQK
jgi:hypothetical protein